MTLANLREINQGNQSRALDNTRHSEKLHAQRQTQTTIVTSIASLIRYLEGHTTKTEVINQLKSIGTPDVANVVTAVNGLHATLKTHKNTDLSEVTKVMTELLGEARKIPKELPKAQEQKFVDYTSQLSGITDTIKAVQEVIKQQKLVAEAPIVNVPETNVHVDAPDLTPLQASLKSVVSAVEGIVIPPQASTDSVEKLLTKSNKLLKDLLEKPISSGGGGSGRVSPYSDAQGAPSFVTLSPEGVIPTASPVLATIITTFGAATYLAQAAPGTLASAAAWRVRKIDATSGTIITWADNGRFSQIATDLTVLTYT